MPSVPIDHPLDLTMQSILTFGSYAIWLSILGYAVWLGMRERTPFYFLIVVAAAFGGLFEPLYDEAMQLYFYKPGMWTTFTSFDIPQPVWVYSGYVTLYGVVSVFLCRQIRRGMSRATLYKWAGVELLCSCVFEMVGINGGAYEYWGPHVFRIFEYPLAIGVLEAAQVICFSVAAANLRARATGIAALSGLVVLFPCTFFLANLGAGAPMIIALHASNPSTGLVALGSTVTIAFAVVLVWGASHVLPVESRVPVAAPGTDARRRLSVPAES